MPKAEALQLARDQELDLVEIAAAAHPPVVKLVDFQKFLYQEEKKKREEKKHARVSETKEIRLGPFMSENDLSTMTRRGREFLEEGHKIRLVLKFRGRQIIHPEFGHKTMGKVIDELGDLSKVDRESHMEGKQLVALISPERKKVIKDENENENQEVSSQTL
jgi:translation initiation factor IF-3